MQFAVSCEVLVAVFEKLASEGRRFASMRQLVTPCKVFTVPMGGNRIQRNLVEMLAEPRSVYLQYNGGVSYHVFIAEDEEAESSGSGDTCSCW